MKENKRAKRAEKGWTNSFLFTRTLFLSLSLSLRNPTNYRRQAFAGTSEKGRKVEKKVAGVRRMSLPVKLRHTDSL